MSDLLQLAALQAFPQENISKSEANPQSHVAFVAIMAHLMSEQDELELGESASQIAVELVLDKGEDGSVLKDIHSERNDIEAMESPIEENISLAWINADSYEPPKIKGEEIKRKDSDDELIQQTSFLQFSQPDGPTPIQQSNPIQLLTEECGKLTTLEQDNESLENTIQIQSSTEEQELIQESTSSRIRIEGQISLTPEAQPFLQEELFEQMEDKELLIPEAFITSQTTDSFFLGNADIVPVASPQVSNTANPISLNKQTAPPPQAALELHQSVDSPEWNEQFNQQILWLGQQKIKSALIKLNPQELGPLEVAVKVVKDSATVNIATHSSQIRDVIEQAIPRLREMMTEQGLNLSQVNIESNANYRQAPQQKETVCPTELEGEELTIIDSVPIKRPRGLIDYFA